MIILHHNCDTILKFFQTETFSGIDPAGPIHTDPNYEGRDSDEEYEKMMAQDDEHSDSHNVELDLARLTVTNPKPSVPSVSAIPASLPYPAPALALPSLNAAATPPGITQPSAMKGKRTHGRKVVVADVSSSSLVPTLPQAQRTSTRSHKKV